LRSPGGSASAIGSGSAGDFSSPAGRSTTSGLGQAAPSADTADPPTPAAPTAPAPTAPARSRDAATPPVRTPDKPPAASPPATPPPPPEASTPPLETTSDVKTLEAQTQTLLDKALRDLSHVELRTLSSDARAQYQLAEGFVKMAQTALREKNLTYARNMAEKAAALASQLPKSGT
jgi:hypothetical protein